jgi:hypothetical protein
MDIKLTTTLFSRKLRLVPYVTVFKETLARKSSTPTGGYGLASMTKGCNGCANARLHGWPEYRQYSIWFSLGIVYAVRQVIRTHRNGIQFQRI